MEKKFLLLLVFCSFSGKVLSVLNCQYLPGGYGCEMSDKICKNFSNIQLSHAIGRRDLDVNIFKVLRTSGAEIVPVGVCDRFQRLSDFIIDGENVKVISKEIFKLCLNVKTLVIQNTKISWLPENVFNNLPQLEKFSITSGHIKILPGSLFKMNPKLNIFFANATDLEVIEIEFSSSVASVSLVGNLCYRANATSASEVQSLNKSIKKNCFSSTQKTKNENIDALTEEKNHLESRITANEVTISSLFSLVKENIKACDKKLLEGCETVESKIITQLKDENAKMLKDLADLENFNTNFGSVIDTFMLNVTIGLRGLNNLNDNLEVYSGKSSIRQNDASTYSYAESSSTDAVMESTMTTEFSDVVDNSAEDQKVLCIDPENFLLLKTEFDVLTKTVEDVIAAGETLKTELEAKKINEATPDASFCEKTNQRIKELEEAKKKNQEVLLAISSLFVIACFIILALVIRNFYCVPYRIYDVTKIEKFVH